MRIPTFILEHPLEAFIAGALLFFLVFGSADRHAAEIAKPAPSAQLAAGRNL